MWLASFSHTVLSFLPPLVSTNFTWENNDEGTWPAGTPADGELRFLSLPIADSPNQLHCTSLHFNDSALVLRLFLTHDLGFSLFVEMVPSTWIQSWGEKLTETSSFHIVQDYFAFPALKSMPRQNSYGVSPPVYKGAWQTPSVLWCFMSHLTAINSWQRSRLASAAAH